MLLESYDYAQDVGCPMWEFAIELEAFQTFGLTPGDWRWLCLKNLVDHGRERHDERRAGPNVSARRRVALTRRTCFVLTEAGERFARQLALESGMHARAIGDQAATPNQACVAADCATSRKSCRSGTAIGSSCESAILSSKSSSCRPRTRKQFSRPSRKKTGCRESTILCHHSAKSIPRGGCTTPSARSTAIRRSRSSAFWATAAGRAFAGNVLLPRTKTAGTKRGAPPRFP